MRKSEEKEIKKTLIGGQALIEGIYMRGPDKMATVVRKPDGTHVFRERPVPKSVKKGIASWPFIRGIFVFGASLKNGVSEIMYSADQCELPEEEPTKFDRWIEKTIGTEAAEKVLSAVAVVFGIVTPILLFFLLPALISGLFDFSGMLWLKNLVEGVIRILIFMIYIIATSRLKDMKRVYSYHGAEHKTIHCYEAGEELTVENVRRHTRKHPRCGTSFLFVVMIISILVFSFLRVEQWFPQVTGKWALMLIRLASRVIFLPVVVNISYEFNRLVGRYDNWFTLALRAPGIWMQTFTTNEPDDEMIEVAIDALTRVIPENKEDDVW